MVMAMTNINVLDAKKRGNIAKTCPNRKKDQAYNFFIGMSMNKEEDNYHQRTPSEQAEHREHLRDREMQLSGGEDVTPQENPSCTVCGTIGQSLCNKCKVNMTRM